MIGKALRFAGSSGPLVHYLFGRGSENEHLNPRAVAAWDPRLVDQDTTQRQWTALLDAPLYGADLHSDAKTIYHLILSSAREGNGQPADKPLTDQEWASIAEDAMRRVGMTSDEPGGDCRWLAVRHDEPGKEHVHIVATMVTEHGQRWAGWNDRYRIGEACRDAEDKHGLRSTRPRDRTSAPALSHAEYQRAERTSKPPTREQLRQQVREAVSRSTSTSGFLEELRSSGLLVTERRAPSGDLTGYAVGRPDLRASDGKTLMFGGGKLASDLTLPKVQARYGEQPAASTTRTTTRERLTPDQRTRMWIDAHHATHGATTALQEHDQDPQAAAGAAWASSDYLAGAARLVDGRKPGRLSAAARDLDLAAREPYGRTPPPSKAGAGLRAAGGLLLAARGVQHDETAQLLALLAQAVTLADALTRLRESQGREHQAAAARRAADGLRELHTDRNTAQQVAAALTATTHTPTQQEAQAWSSTRTR